MVRAQDILQQPQQRREKFYKTGTRTSSGSSLFSSASTKIRLDGPFVGSPTFSRSVKTHVTDKLQLRGQNLGRVFNSRSGCLCAAHLCSYEAKQPRLKLKTRPKQL